jgi:adenylate cyclase
LVLLAGYELAICQFVGRQLEHGKTLPRWLRFCSAFVETSVPSVLILLGSRQVDPVYLLQGAATYLYAVFIVLSTLRLDFMLSVFTGCVAAAQYVVLSAVVIQGSEVAAGTLFSVLPFYLAKGVTLVLAGFAAGFVADQIKRRVMRVFHAVEERQRIVSAFGQQVSPAIVEELLKQGPEIPSKRTFVCVLFMDIRGFTRLVEKKTPEEIVAYQNAVFSAAIEIVDRNQGVINQFVGDGFMATFGAPVATGRDCKNALRTARELLAAVKALSDSGRIPATSIGIGLHAGEAVSGNIGSQARQQYSISGNVVILASRIEQLNKERGSQLLVSAEVLREAGEDANGAESLGWVQVKGRDQPIEIYRLA